MTTTFQTFPIIPADGTTLTRPIEGWRYAYTDGRNIHGFESNTRHVDPCHEPIKPAFGGLVTAFNFPGLIPTHDAPHPDCACGFRVVNHAADLSTYLEKHLTASHYIGGDRQAEPGMHSIVLLRVEGSGLAARGEIPPEDPAGTIRVSQVRLLEIYAPDHLDHDRLARGNGVPVRNLSTIPADLFPTVRAGRIPETPNRIEEYGNWFRLIVGHQDFKVYKGHLNQEVAEAVQGILECWRNVEISTPAGERLWAALLDAHITETDPLKRVTTAYGAASLLAAMA